jgi:hypothetical protein
MPNLILQIDDLSMVKKYINTTTNVVIVYFYGFKYEDKFNKFDKIKKIFSKDLPKSIHVSFVKCNLTKQFTNIINEHKLLRYNQKMLIKHKNKMILCNDSTNKIKKIIEYLNTNNMMITRSYNKNVDLFK